MFRFLLALLTLIYFSSLGLCQTTSAGDGKKPTKTRDKLRFRYGQVDEIYSDGELDRIHCQGKGNMKCKQETVSGINTGHSQNDINYLDQLSDDIVAGLLKLYPKGEPPHAMMGHRTRYVTLILPDLSVIHRLYRVDWTWDESGFYREESSYIDL